MTRKSFFAALPILSILIGCGSDEFKLPTGPEDSAPSKAPQLKVVEYETIIQISLKPGVEQSYRLQGRTYYSVSELSGAAGGRAKSATKEKEVSMHTEASLRDANSTSGEGRGMTVAGNTTRRVELGEDGSATFIVQHKVERFNRDITLSLEFQIIETTLYFSQAWTPTVEAVGIE